MAKAIRYDSGSLRSPTTTPHGFLRADGITARIGVQEYHSTNGGVRRELRLPEEVFRADVLAQFEGVPLTDGHPPEMVTAANASKYTRGSVTQAARQDGDLVAASIVVTDPTLIKKIRGGATGLSVGYSVDLDETPGVHPQYGRYDAIQRNITINHLAAAVIPRAGEVARIRMDGVSIDVARSDGRQSLTTAVDGHQHLLDELSYEGVPKSAGCTSWAIAEGSDAGHDHPWVRNADGSISVGESAGHTHTLLSTDRYFARSDGQQIDQPRGRGEVGRMADNTTMSPDEQIRALKHQLEVAEGKLRERTDAADTTARERDAARGELKTAQERVDALERQLAAGATAVESVAVQQQKERIDELELALAKLKGSQPEAIRRAAALRVQALAVMPRGFRIDEQSDRAIRCAVITHFSPKESTGAEVSDAYLEARFDSLVAAHMDNARSLTRIGELASPKQATGSPAESTRESRAAAFRQQALAPKSAH